jgi:peptide/nickel transport system permease protein
MLPGDPGLIMAGEERDPAVIEQMSAVSSTDRFRFNIYWVQGAIRQSRESMRIHVPVLDLILRSCR